MLEQNKLNQMENKDYMTIEVEGISFQVYREPDFVPNPKGKINASRAPFSQVTCYYCRNPGHKIVNCPYYELNNEASAAVTNLKTNMPSPPAPSGKILPSVPGKSLDQGSCSNPDKPSTCTLTSLLERMDSLEGSMRSIANEVANLTRALEFKNTCNCNQKRKNMDLAYGQASSEKQKKPRFMAEGPSLHQLANANEDSNGTSLPSKVYQRIPRSDKKCFACQKHGHFVANCPERK